MLSIFSHFRESIYQNLFGNYFFRFEIFFFFLVDVGHTTIDILTIDGIWWNNNTKNVSKMNFYPKKIPKKCDGRRYGCVILILVCAVLIQSDTKYIVGHFNFGWFQTGFMDDFCMLVRDHFMIWTDWKFSYINIKWNNINIEHIWNRRW